MPKRNWTTAQGHELRAKRLTAGLSQAALAALCGVSPSYVGELERGLHGPNVNCAKRLSEVVDSVVPATKPTPLRPPSQPRAGGARDDEVIAELNAMTPLDVVFTDGCVHHGTVGRTLDEALADHQARHGAGEKRV